MDNPARDSAEESASLLSIQSENKWIFGSKPIIYYFMRIFGPLIIIMTTIILGSSIIFLCFYPLIHSASLFLNIAGFLLSLLQIFFIFVIIYALTLITTGDRGSTSDVIKCMRPWQRNLLESLPKCHKCGLPKPARAHHCRVCGCCQLKMDHHCPAVGVCITVRNQQPFIVMIFWGTLACFYSFAFIFIRFLGNFSRTQSTLFDGVISLGSLLIGVILAFFLKDTMSDVRRNVTTLESLLGLPMAFDLGADENLRQVFGSGAVGRYWPMKSRMSGFEWSDPNMRGKM